MKDKTKNKDKFYWGVSTSALQIEGATQIDGRSDSIWDVFSRTPGNIINGDTPERGCDHYHRWQEDLDLMSDLSLQMYRFSFSWPRIAPEGNKNFNPKGIAFYDRLIDGLLNKGIEPMITLNHWDLPQVLQEKGGWENPELAKNFSSYAAEMFHRFGDRVRFWTTHNEPWIFSILGHLTGVHAPGLKSLSVASIVGHHLLYGHKLAQQAFRSENITDGQLGMVFNFSPVHAVDDQPENMATARRIDAFMNRWFLDPVLKGSYPQVLVDLWEEHGISYPLDNLQLLSGIGSLDYIGINYYSRSIVKKESESNPPGGAIEKLLNYRGVKPSQAQFTSLEWEIYPRGIYEITRMIKEDYHNIPMFIAENGAAFEDRVEDHGQIHDLKRLDYIKSHILEVQRAINDGMNVRGYLVWSLLDNFEWAFGYNMRFGLIYVDYETQKRFVKDSGWWYKDFILNDRKVD